MAMSDLGVFPRWVGDGHMFAFPSHKAGNAVPLRKAHTKSRNGCIPCKRRKIKCDEEKPICQNCSHRNTNCEYLPVVYSGRSARQPPIDVFVTNLSASDFASPPSDLRFSLREMRYFHHFLMAVPHPLPLGNRKVWASDVPQIAHQHVYLMNAMLALGASELHAEHPDAGMEPDIFKHRGRAIAGLQKAMNDTSSWTRCGHPDAILATCYILVSQSSRMRDATDDFNIAVRGCALVTEKLRRDKIKTSFQLNSEGLYEKLRQSLRQANHRLAMLPSPEPALRALIDLEEHTFSSSARPFAEALSRTMLKFQDSPTEAYIESLDKFSTWYNLALGVIDSLRNPEEAVYVMILEVMLLANMIWLKVLIPLMIWPRPSIKSTDNPIPVKAMIEITHWIEATVQFVPYERQRLLDWPLRVADAVPWKTLQANLPSHEIHSASVAAKLDILRNIDTQAHTMLGWILRLSSELASWFEGYVCANTSTAPKSQALERNFGPVPIPLGQIDIPVRTGSGTDKDSDGKLDPSVLDADEFPFLLFSRLG